MLLFYVIDISVSFHLAMSRASMWVGHPCSFYPSPIWVILMVSMHMKNAQIEGRTCHVREFEDTVVLDSKLKTNMEIK
jgi:hypothetical protein